MAPSRLLERMDVDTDGARRRRAGAPGAPARDGQRRHGRGAGVAALSVLLDDAGKEAERLKDEYVSVEHLVLAMIKSGSSAAGRLLKGRGVSADRFLEALTQVRGAQRVTSATPESAYEALEEYGRDLVADARSGKLDPVIGRDAEIRRVVQILSRKTKKQPGARRRSACRQDRDRRGTCARGGGGLA
jgi:ATP-dependent Clp protease ATP-binding subunit ClpB